MKKPSRPPTPPPKGAESGVPRQERRRVRARHAGALHLREELARLRAVPRVRKARRSSFIRTARRPTAALRRAEGRHDADAAHPPRGIRPGGKSQKHGHVNEAAFYILDGKGYEIHDGVKYEWQAGDVVVVHNNCVHQHFNATRTSRRRALVLKAKPIVPVS